MILAKLFKEIENTLFEYEIQKKLCIRKQTKKVDLI